MRNCSITVIVFRDGNQPRGALIFPLLTEPSITELWSTGQQASSDSMCLDTAPHPFYARVDPARRTHEVGIYTRVLDQHGIVYNQPALNERQAGVAIEDVIHHNESHEDGGLLRLSVDTHR